MAERDPKDGYANLLASDVKEWELVFLANTALACDRYIPGSILKVELTNFVTYDSVSFTPGPHLNMIIGPNGTGKSTISCAICLGLGWPPALLGRATKISAFVKHGAEHGSITITMKNKAGMEPLIIRRTIHSANDGSQWSLNGKQTTLTAIQDQVEKLNVQVSNLCTFLPQDRVCEFAAMTPQQLLVETQRCAGNENLPEWHEQLIEDAKKEKTLREVRPVFCK
ncbi:P-loop containing nucleoside triphosphate hydrolase protein [Atractiella rhizophila]|nr:P-loop containing nucleoside triphosphate hydrolase protein [Atractiella rhizophila]